MNHGSQQYFLERSRFARRVSATTVGVATLALSILLITERTALRHELNVPEHFGFEGREQYSHRLELEAYGPQRDSPDAPYGVNYTPHSNRGGGIGRRAEHLVEVQVQGGDPTGLLEREATAAVLQCVIRPYRVDGTAQEIVARFPFNFYLRD